MKPRVFPLSLFLFLAVFAGCQTMTPSSGEKETREEMETSVHTVANVLAGREVSEEELRKINEDIRTDPETQSAVKSIAGSLNQSSRGIKYCPVDGKRYSAHLNKCPEHGVLLKFLEE